MSSQNGNLNPNEPIYNNFKELVTSLVLNPKEERHYSILSDGKIYPYVKDKEARKKFFIIDIHIREIRMKIDEESIYDDVTLNNFVQHLHKHNLADIAPLCNELKGKISEGKIYKVTFEVQVCAEDWMDEKEIPMKYALLKLKWNMRTEKRAYAVASTYCKKFSRIFDGKLFLKSTTISRKYSSVYPAIRVVPLSEVERVERELTQLVESVIKESESLRQKTAQPREEKERKIEITEEIVQAVLKDWMRIWIFKPNFVTEKRGAERVYEIIEEDGVKKVLDGYKYEEIKRELERFRVRFYRQFINRKTIQTPLGKAFIEIDDDTKSELNSWIEAYYRIVDKVFEGKIRPKPCELYEVMLPKKIVKKFVEEYVAELRARLKNLEEKIKELEGAEDRKTKKKLKDAIKEKKRVEEMLEFAESVLEKHFGKKKPEIVSERVEALKEEIENGE